MESEQTLAGADAFTAPLRERRIRTHGLTLRVLECLPEPAAANGRLALCLHGFPECAHAWRHQLPLLARAGYRAWAPDLRGYGGSDRPTRREDHAIEVLLGDVAGLAEAAGAGPGETLLIGHDWGAILAWYFAMRQPAALERLVVMNVPHPACYAAQLGIRQLARSWYALLFQVPGLAEWLLGRRGPRWVVDAIRGSAVHPERFDDAAMRPFVENAAAPGALTSMLSYYRAAIAGGGFRRQARLGYPRIRVPTLMLWGERDLALTRETSFGTAAFVEPLVQRYLPDASHWVQQDAPEQVNAMLDAWLRGDPVPHAPGANADIG